MTDHSVEVTPADTVLIPVTGEVVRADDIAGLALALSGLRDLRYQVNEAISAITAAVAHQSGVQGTKTLRADGWQVELSGDHDLEWDMDELEKLRDAGLPEERFDALVTQTVSYKVNALVAKQIAGANPEYAAIIERARQEVPRRPTAKVSRS